MNKEFFEALKLMEAEKGIPAEYLAEKIASAIVVAAKKDHGGRDVVHCDIDLEKQELRVYLRKNVVEEIADAYTDLLPEEARRYDPAAQAGGFVDIPLDTRQFGRIVAQTAKHVIRQGIREAERGQVLQEFKDHDKELVTAVIQRVDPKTGNATVTIGKNEAVLPRAEQMPEEVLSEGDHVKVYVIDVKETEKGPKVMISRTHAGLVRRLFENEVPEIYDGTIQVRAIAREAGSRTKMAVWSENSEIDAVGACIGQRGARVNRIVEELGGEKIDIVRYSDDPVAFISEALSPAKVLGVEIEEGESRACRATVPDAQLSLAIGNKGQNVRLAARLTGWKIDIRPESGFYGEEED